MPAIIAFCGAYVGAEVPAYPWDHGAYWRAFQNFGRLIASSADYWPRMVIDLIRTSDYNPAAVIPLYPFYASFGGGRTVYVTAIALLYLLPAVLLAVWISVRSELRGVLDTAALFLIGLTYLPLWTPTLRGMVDIVGLVFLGLATLIVFRSDYLSRRPLANALLLGLLLWAPFLFRRWYAYSIVAFFVVAFVFGWAARHRRGLPWFSAGIAAAAPLTIAGMLVLALVAAFQSDLALRILSTSYVEIHDAYKKPLGENLGMFADRVGGYVLAMMVAGVVATVLTRKTEVAFCLGVALATFVLFTHTQYMGVHHFLPVAFWLFPLYATGVLWAAGKLVFLPVRMRIVPFALIAAVIFGASVAPSVKVGGTIASIFVPTWDNKPKHLDNFSEYQRLIADLKTRLGPGEQVVVFASGLALSDALLAALDPDLEPRISFAAQVAKISFFNFENLRADYAVVTSPAQTHLAPGSQINITLPGQLILSASGFGAAYEMVPGATYRLSEGATAYLYRRIRAVSAAEMGDLLHALAAHYPDWLSRYRSAFDIPLASREVQLGETWGRAELAGPDTLFLHPGASRPTSVSIRFDPALSGTPTSLLLAVPAEVLKSCADADGVSVTVALDGADLWTGDVTPGDRERIELPGRPATISINVEKRSQPNCDRLIATFERHQR